MPGMIVGVYGYQRSGKSLLAYLISSICAKKGIKVYSNVDVKRNNFIKIEDIKEIPVDRQPKVLWLDEAYYYLDSRNWHGNKVSSLFFNSICKMNILLLLTAIEPGTIEVRIRNQHDYMVFAKKTDEKIIYEIIGIKQGRRKTVELELTEKLFEEIDYDHTAISDYVEMNIKDFVEYIKASKV